MSSPTKVAWISASVAAAVFAGLMAILVCYAIIPVSEMLRNLAVAIGWLLTVTVATTQLSASRLESERTKREDRRASLELEASKQVAAAAVELTKSLSGVSAPFSTAAVMLKSPLLIGGEQSAVRLASAATVARVELHRAWAQFVFTVESYQIVLLPFEYLRIFIGFKVHDVAEAIGRLTCPPSAANQLDQQVRSHLAAEANSIWSELWDIMTYVGDFRVEVMNALTGTLFEQRVPRRRPMDTSRKTLIELCSKQSVEAESKRRAEEAIRAVHAPDNPTEPPA